ncbi:MAG TPA: PIN domain-containing protein [Solirubrobacteraceae bacterium]|nr:PIN domain-containing protein [Solirubrobacteraceae bacterium]
MSLFVDSSVLYAVADQADRYKKRAQEVVSTGERLVTTDQVLAESWLLIQRRLGWNHAERFWGRLRAGRLAMEHLRPGDLDHAWRIGESFPDQGFSIVDRISFAVMERLGIDQVATFDDHFSIYRYGPRRERAFDVRR